MSFQGGFRMSCYVCARCRERTGRFIVSGKLAAKIPVIGPGGDLRTTTAQIKFESCANCFMDVTQDVLAQIRSLLSEEAAVRVKTNPLLYSSDAKEGGEPAKPCCDNRGVIDIVTRFEVRVAKFEMRPLIFRDGNVGPNDPAYDIQRVGCENCFHAIANTIYGKVCSMADGNDRFDPGVVLDAVRNIEFPYCGRLVDQQGENDGS